MPVLEAARPEARTPRRRVVPLVVVGALVALAAGGVAAATVHAVDAAALSGVHVFLDGTPITCADPADVTSVTSGGTDDDSVRVPSVRGALDLDCTLSVIVQNSSDRPVDVDRITFPFLAARGGVGLHSDYSFTQGLRPRQQGEDREDAVFDFAHDGPIGVAAGAAQRFRIHLVSDGCRQAGATTTFGEVPIVTVSTGLASVDRRREGVGFGFVGARTTAQPCR